MTKSKGLHPKSNRERSFDTKRRISQAAQRLFASQGYEKTTMRAIAKVAQVDAALVVYYFTSKQQLFMEVMMPAQVQVQADDLHSLAGVSLSRLANALATSLADRLASTETKELLIGIIRAATSEPKAAVLLQSHILEHITVQFEHYFEPEEARLRSALVGGQMVGFAFARYVAQMPALQALSHAQLVAYLTPTIRTALMMPLE